MERQSGNENQPPAPLVDGIPKYVHPNKRNPPPPANSKKRALALLDQPKKTSYSLILVEGIESMEEACQLLVACKKSGSMLRDKIETVSGELDFRITVEVREKGKMDLVVHTNWELCYGQKKRIQSIFEARCTVGYLDWFGGATGWRFDTTTKSGEGSSWKRRAVVKLNTLQSVFALLAPDEQKYLFPYESKKLTWKKHAELTSIVSDIWVWLESITPKSPVVKKLLRNSQSGPDTPVNWAHHHPSNDYPLTVVTDALMQELADGVINLFRQLFGGTEEKPLGTMWRNHKQRRVTDWKEARKDYPEWTVERLEKRLNLSGV
mmetsp:Transcript_31366/g.66313  ORF Transcript_31366/g.66313 Transcript_31366/m.66313 type:complete len:321 (+) Transcript_31366:518-1480(+)|eukprot:CAMPEP_0171337566 /NCGR_PEP_ID=MMETSP0878-20121228/6758_1 /TAXON_ID=67004 /ORGANISM="Thalassiosira weissflogii, Strain CCMP1336" /LENGTH=320 /DNA_ID=CAMNT_0011839195 /DNA_START=529 /DNA_END=1491 /DNA_ORIENTATION=-